MILANGKGRMSTLAVDDDLDMNGRNITNADVVSVNEHVTLVGARLPGKGFRHVERNGWSMSKDNNDIERKFWKDDFSVDSSDQYTVDGNVTGWGTGSITLPYNSSFRKTITAGTTKVGVSFSFPVGAAAWHSLTVRLTASRSFRITTDDNGKFLVTVGKSDVSTPQTYNGLVVNTSISKDTSVHFASLEFNRTDGKVKFTFDNQSVISTNSFEDIETDIFGLNSSLYGCIIYELTYSPSISYADNFTSDTVTGANGRYQAVTGTVAYDDVNKRMNVITATGANGKASGRLKSYKFTEGSQIYDVTLPTGADGDFITLVTHSANGLMTDGIGVGLQSDGAGNWNLATLSGTTVTEGADSGLDDADVARIEIEKDLSGAYWYYIYDAAGTKPTTATGKLFTTKSEGYTGWYANGAGAETQTYAINNISIRAESIVGRTNVPVEEPFWFRDEFSENSLGRYITEHGTIANGKLTISHYYFYCTLPMKVSGTASVETKVVDWVESTWASINLFAQRMSGTGIRSGYKLEITESQNSSFRLWKNNDVVVTVTNKTLGLTEATLKLTFDSDTNTVTGYLNGEALITYVDETPYTSGYALLDTYNTTNPISFEYIEISGTRVYNKPIHRGAMLETYHDGTQEVVGTTEIYDCNWDQIAELTKVGSSVAFDITNGRLNCPGAGASGVYTKNQYSDGYICATFNNPTSLTVTKIAFRSSATSSLGSGSEYKYMTGTDGANLYLYRIDNTTPVSLGSYAYVPTVGVSHKIEVLFVGSSIKVYLNGTLRITATDTTYTSGYIGFGKYHLTDAAYASDIQIIAASPDATNGIAACIPPIGGGARYGVNEEVCFNIANEVRYSEGVAMTTVKTTNPANEGVEMFFGNTADSSKITTDDTDVEVISLEDTSYKDVVKEIVLNYDDRGDEIKVGVRKTGDNVATVYVETLAVVPKVEVV